MGGSLLGALEGKMMRRERVEGRVIDFKFQRLFSGKDLNLADTGEGVGEHSKREDGRRNSKKRNDMGQSNDSRPACYVEGEWLGRLIGRTNSLAIRVRGMGTEDMGVGLQKGTWDM